MTFTHIIAYVIGGSIGLAAACVEVCIAVFVVYGGLRFFGLDVSRDVAWLIAGALYVLNSSIKRGYKDRIKALEAKVMV